MFWKLFQKKTAVNEPPQPQAAPSSSPSIPAPVGVAPAVSLSDPNDWDRHSIAQRAAARGRYELASSLMAYHADWYEKNIVQRPMKGDTASDRARFREYLQEYRDATQSLKKAAADRERVLQAMAATSTGLTRKELETACPLTSDIAYGIFLNQLIRGDWVTLEGDKKLGRYRLSGTQRVADSLFLKEERGRQAR